MTPLIRKILGMNWLLLGVSFLLCVLGVIAVYSASSFRTEEYYHKQMIWVAAGIVVFLVTSLIDYRWVKWAALPMYIVSIFLVILTYTGMGQEHGGAKCWLLVPGVGTFQPSQMALIAAVLTMGLFLSQFRRPLFPAQLTNPCPDRSGTNNNNFDPAFTQCRKFFGKATHPRFI